VRFAARATRPREDLGIPSLSPNPLSWATVAVDEFAICSAYLVTRRRAEKLTLDRLDAAERALEVLEADGVTADPLRLYPAPSAPDTVRLTTRSRGGLDFEQLSYDSAAPAPSDLASLTEWQHISNDRVHAYLLRHDDGDRPWAVVIHGHRMGEARDIRFLGSRQLFTDLGVNVAHLVLPMHGPRGRRDAHAFPGVDPVANLLGVTQAVSDARALLAWIRSETDQPVGVFGISLGGLIAGMLAAFEPDLHCVVTGVPLTNVAMMLGMTVRSRWGEEALAETHFMDPAPMALSGLASPLSYAPVVPHDRRFIYAAVGDRLVTARQAEALWQHWGQPTILWLQGAHILNNMRSSRRFVSRAFAASGVASR
jgi:pimeloyl-ACP methyl ester carboxylesterase